MTNVDSMYIINTCIILSHVHRFSLVLFVLFSLQVEGLSGRRLGPVMLQPKHLCIMRESNPNPV